MCKLYTPQANQTDYPPARATTHRLPVQLVEMQEDGPIRGRVQDPGGPAEGEHSLPGAHVPRPAGPRAGVGGTPSPVIRSRRDPILIDLLKLNGATTIFTPDVRAGRCSRFL